MDGGVLVLPCFVFFACLVLATAAARSRGRYAAATGQEVAGCGASGAEMAEIFGCTGACASSLIGAVTHWVSSHAHKLVAAGIGTVSGLVVAGVTFVAVASCGAAAGLTEDPFVAHDCYKIGAIGFSVALTGFASAVEGWKVEKN
jgi:hypothetical protein